MRPPDKLTVTRSPTLNSRLGSLADTSFYLLIWRGDLGEYPDDFVRLVLLLLPVNGNGPFEFRVVAVELSVDCIGHWLATTPVRGGMTPIRPVGLCIAVDYDDPAIWQEQGQRSTMHGVTPRTRGCGGSDTVPDAVLP
jgi:hypothetical protein